MLAFMNFDWTIGEAFQCDSTPAVAHADSHTPFRGNGGESMVFQKSVLPLKAEGTVRNGRRSRLARFFEDLAQLNN